MADDSQPAQASGALLASYEEIRCEALRLAGRSHCGHGLALFIRRGMAAWLTACAPLVRMREVLDTTAEERVPSDLRGEVAIVLAEMALSAADPRSPTC